jgi:hypothetical protein
MAGEIGDGELFVAQRRHQQDVHFPEHARHFQRHLAAEPVGLHEVDGERNRACRNRLGQASLT